MWPFFITLICPQLLVIMFVYGLFFALLYPLYAILSLITFGPFGVVSSWFVVFQYSAVASTLLSTALFTSKTQNMVFDSVLAREGHEKLLAEAKRQRKHQSQSKSTAESLLAAYKITKDVMCTVAREICYGIFGLIPVFGPCIVVMIKAPSRGFNSHARYFQLKRLSKNQAKEMYRRNKSQYFWFGVAAVLLEMIPFTSLFFRFTTTVGLALWAIDIETSTSH